MPQVANAQPRQKHALIRRPQEAEDAPPAKRMVIEIAIRKEQAANAPMPVQVLQEENIPTAQNPVRNLGQETATRKTVSVKVEDQPHLLKASV